MTKILNVFNKINSLRERYYKASTGKDALIKLIAETEVAEQVYNSNAIENSTLTLEETEKILLQIDLDRYITEREIFEAKNLARVVSYIDQRAKEQELNFEVILLLHKMLISNIRDDVAGRFRKDDEYVRVGNHIAPNSREVVGRLEKMLAEYSATSHENIIKRIARLHLTFEYIHPFVDGNGRIGRVINNYLFIREGFVPINIKFIDRKKYYDAFKEFDEKGLTTIMEEIVGKALTNSYYKRLAYLEGKKIITLADYAKNNKISHSNLINKANRQTIEAFLEKNVWKIGIVCPPSEG
jgi:Fic family protein